MSATADGLRKLADFLDDHPDLTLLGGSVDINLYSYGHSTEFLDGLSICDIDVVRTFDDYVLVRRPFGGITAGVHLPHAALAAATTPSGGA